MEYVSSQFWCGLRKVLPDQPYAYGIVSNGLLIFDISDIQNPSILARCYLPEGYATDISIYDHRAYITDWGGVLYIIDISVPQTPIIIGRWEVPELTYGVSASQSIAAVTYVHTQNPNGTLILDVADPQQITILDDIPAAMLHYKVWIQDDSLLYIIGGNSMELYNIGDVPAQMISNFPFGEHKPVDIFLSDTLAVVAAPESFWPAYVSVVYVLNMANPSIPQASREYSLPGIVGGVRLKGNFLYTANNYNGCWSGDEYGFRIYDITQPDSTALLSRYYSGMSVLKIDWADSLAFVANTTPVLDCTPGSIIPFPGDSLPGEFQILDVSNPANPHPIGDLDLGPQSTGVTVNGNLAFVLNDDSLGPDIRIVDISNPGLPTCLGTYNTQGPAQTLMAINDSIVCLAAGMDGLQFINLADPENPQLIGSALSSYSARDFILFGNYAYVADDYGGLWVWNIADPVSPVAVDSLPLPGRAISITRYQLYLYLSLVDSGVAIVEISLPEDPAFLSQLSPIVLSNQVANNNGCLYSLFGSGFRIYSLADPAHPLPDTIYYASDTRCISTFDKYVFVARGSDGIEAVDVSDPTNPILTAHYNTPGYSVGVMADSAYVYIADKYSWIILRSSLIDDIIPGETIIPREFNLKQNFPNPFNSSTNIEFVLNKLSYVSLDVYNILGQKVITLFSGIKAAGTYRLQWDGQNATGSEMPSGIYIYRLQAEGEAQSRAMLLLK